MTEPCAWAACTRPAYRFEGGWWHCREHLREHRAENAPDTSTVEDDVRSLYEAGVGVTAIARELGIGHERVRLIRDRLGLPYRPREVAAHGTDARARKHRREGETPCRSCLEAERLATNERKARRRDVA